MHRSLRDFRVTNVPGTRELFDIPPIKATLVLEACPENHFVDFDRLIRLKHDLELQSFLKTLFRISGLDLLLDAQGIWTFSLYPRTSGGRIFTINIAQHEVAYAYKKDAMEKTRFSIAVDPLFFGFSIRSFLPEWLNESGYVSATDRLAFHRFSASFSEAEELIQQSKLRRAIVSYWLDHLIHHRENGGASLHAKHHNSNAVRDIINSAQ